MAQNPLPPEQVQALIDDAVTELHAQQDIVPTIDCPWNRPLVLRLLSNSLREFNRLERHRRAPASLDGDPQVLSEMNDDFALIDRAG